MAKRKAAKAAAVDANGPQDRPQRPRVGKTPRPPRKGAPPARKRVRPAGRAEPGRRRQAQAAAPRRQSPGEAVGAPAPATRAKAAAKTRPRARRATRRTPRRTASRRRPRRSTWTVAASAAARGRAEMAETPARHTGMTPDAHRRRRRRRRRGRRTSPARKRPAATTPHPTRTSSTTSARRWASNTGQRGAEGERQDHRARQAPLGARSGVVGGLQRAGNRGWEARRLGLGDRDSSDDLPRFTDPVIACSHRLRPSPLPARPPRRDLPVVSIDDRVRRGIERRRGARPIGSSRSVRRVATSATRGRAAGVRGSLARRRARSSGEASR